MEPIEWDARNVYASAEDTSGNLYSWNLNYEANALTDRDVFRVFRDGNWNVNTYRKEPAVSWWLRSLYNGSTHFLAVGNNGILNPSNDASGARRVRPLYYAIKKKEALCFLLFFYFSLSSIRISISVSLLENLNP